jgi:hypothetical protein
MDIILGIITTAFLILWGAGSIAGQLFGYDEETKK